MITMTTHRWDPDEKFNKIVLHAWVSMSDFAVTSDTKLFVLGSQTLAELVQNI